MKIFLTFLLALALCIAGMGAYYWVTYIDKTITVGDAYGYKIGISKQEAAKILNTVTGEFPKAHVYISFGEKAGDFFSIPVTPDAFVKYGSFDKWTVFLEGENNYSNNITLFFRDEKLVEIYRHRQYFELP